MPRVGAGERGALKARHFIFVGVAGLFFFSIQLAVGMEQKVPIFRRGLSRKKKYYGIT